MGFFQKETEIGNKERKKNAMISHGKDVKVFCANANRPFAETVCRELGLPLGNSTVTTFADGEVSVSINETGGVDAERIAQLLEGFSVRYPDLEIVLRSGPDAADAVWDGTAEVALLPAGRSLPRGLSRLALHTDAMPGQEIVWKRVAPVSPGDCFVEYLWEQGAVGSGNSGQNVV